jgi:DNA-binding transcriptional LysR family regulator
MDLRQLQYVEAVARWENFTRAAANLHVAQPALSRAVANLEEELGVRLFDRTSRRVRITEAGQALVVRARRILADVANLSLVMDEFGRGTRGVVRLSTWYHLEPMLPLFLRAFLADNAGLDVSVVELPAAEMLEALRHDEIDFGCAFVESGSDLTEIASELIRHEPLMLLVAEHDALSSQPSVRIEELQERSFILARHGTGLRRFVDAAFVRAGFEPRVAVQTNEAAAAAAYVAVGLGVALTPRSIAPSVTAHVVMVPIAGAPLMDMALAWHEGGYRSPAADLGLAFARAEVAREALEASTR